MWDETALESLQTFGQYYEDRDAESVVKILKIIQQKMAVWWKANRGQCPRKSENNKEQNLYYEYYRLKDKLELIEASVPKIGRYISNFTPNQKCISLNGINFRNNKPLTNPVEWVREVFANEDAFNKRYQNLDEHYKRDSSLVHGDFHAGNILVEERSSGDPIIWFIDFPHTHIGPTVQDIARLEADIKFGLFPEELIEPNFDAILAFEEAILSADSRQRLDLLDGLIDEKKYEKLLSPELLKEAWPEWAIDHKIEPTSQKLGLELAKIWQALAILRRPARKHYLSDDARPYYLALLHATLPMLYYRDRSDWQKFYAFISAALLCERLGG